jgi:limonene-1,2-epoxide hydrolase
VIELSQAENEAERLALRLFLAMENGNLAAEVQSLCSDDFVWANSGLATLQGKSAVLEHMANGGFTNTIPILKDMTSFSADLLYIASRGPIVFTERIDHHWDAAGRDLMTPHIAGVMEIQDGKITALRDFYDTVCYDQQPTSPDPAHATR